MGFNGSAHPPSPDLHGAGANPAIPIAPAEVFGPLHRERTRDGSMLILLQTVLPASSAHYRAQASGRNGQLPFLWPRRLAHLYSLWVVQADTRTKSLAFPIFGTAVIIETVFSSIYVCIISFEFPGFLSVPWRSTPFFLRGRQAGSIPRRPHREKPAFHYISGRKYTFSIKKNTEILVVIIGVEVSRPVKHVAEKAWVGWSKTGLQVGQ
ncbi:hypothetical protein J7T55_003261 [Diaporthe amygdali]|uniref:uncharacterized protein n=1 Tax=Phomopsis amygdali TaxID=1214568 RepID=UPI0022FDDC93|nr:uncharacterized protein J7T55_003261 [Diaporthe amygdali]KAJ0122745.1 hypothetical protein J7T55_003261 [Diaporthe amygdali]